MSRRALRDRLRLREGELVTLVGSGGKTTLIGALTRETLAGGGTVAVSTTTRLLLPPESTPETVLREGRPGWPDPPEAADLRRRLEEGRHLGIADRLLEGGKWAGLPPETVEMLYASMGADLFLVEGDGAKHLPLKCHRPDEPVIPDSTGCVLQVVGADGLGQPIDPGTIHRWELGERRLSLRAGEALTPSRLLDLVLDPEGVPRAVPAGARWTLVLNRVPVDADREEAVRAARDALAREPRIDRVVIGEVREDPVGLDVATRRVRAAAVVLAAGGATRFPGKLLQRWGDGAVAAGSVAAALEAGLDPVVVVVGCDADRVWSAAAGSHRREARLVRVDHAGWQEGMASSLAAGVRALPDDLDFAGFFLADQPAIGRRAARAVVDALRTDGPGIVHPVHRGEQGHPVFFKLGRYREELLALTGDRGAKALLGSHHDDVKEVPVDDSGVLADVDRPEDLERLAEGRLSEERPS
jgi:molybdenum cofactor cytidylyltransferase